MTSTRAARIAERTQKHRDAAARAMDGFVRTPAVLADEIVSGHRDIGALPAGAIVLEPSAGDGRVVRAVLDNDADAIVYAVEPNEERADALDAIEGEKPGYAGRVRVIRSTLEDFLRDYSGYKFDAAIMNPPFGDSSRDLVWMDHVRLVHEVLRPGALLVSIVPPSYAFRSDKAHRAMRAWAEGLCGRFVKLPGQPFAESGTGVQAGVLTLPKPMPARADGRPGWLHAPAVGVPVYVPGRPVVTSAGALAMPVQEYDDRSDGSRPRVIRYVGECFGCGRCVWEHDDRSDAAVWEACTFDAADQGQAGPSVVLCLDCYHGGAAACAAALAAVAPYWTPAADDAEPAGPTVYPMDLGAGLWVTVRGPNRDGEVSTLTGRVMADPEAAALGVVEGARDRVSVRVRTAGGRDVELYPLHDQPVIVRDVPGDVIPESVNGGPREDFPRPPFGVPAPVESEPARAGRFEAAPEAEAAPDGFVSGWAQLALPV